MRQATSYKTSQFALMGQRLSNPFPGLRPFGIDEAHLFFGREGQSDEILLKLAQSRFAAVLGFSGSGKSSLVYCGLVPTLHGGFMTEAGANWQVVVMRPGVNPIDNLAEALLRDNEAYGAMSAEEKAIRRTVVATILRSSSLGLVEVVRTLREQGRQNVLLLVDQFEEIFRYKKLETRSGGLDESGLFVGLLVEAVRSEEEPIYVTITMRSDFIGECALFPELTQMINDSHYLIPQMNREEKRVAVEGPVAVGGGKIAPRLVQQLLNDVGESPDQLPILQHALMRTWQYWQTVRRGEDDPIDLQHYNAIGTLKEALSQHANEAYDMLSQREQRICEVMFKALTEKGDESQMIRRPTSLGVMAAIAGVSEDDMARVVDRFREPGRTLLMPPHETAIDSDTVIDISHESLMRIWTRLKAWVEEEVQAAEMYLKLSEASSRYQAGSGGLWQMPDLQLALNWKQETKPTLLWGKRYHPAFERAMVFLDTSRRAYENEQANRESIARRRRRTTNIVTLVFAVAFLVCIFLLYLSLTKAAEADNQKLAALEAAENATKSEARAKEQAAVAEKARKEADKARDEAQQNYERAEESAAEAREQQALAQREASRARRAEKEAQNNLVAAQKAQKEAKEAQTQAEQNAQLAQEEAARADGLRFEAIAQAMGSKVVAVRDVEQRSLIAMHAYLFNEEYGKRLYNADIYAGVYNAYKTTAGDTHNHYLRHEGGVQAVAFGAGDTEFFSSSSDGRVYAWDIKDDKKSSRLVYAYEGEERAVLNVLEPIIEKRRLVISGIGTSGLHIIRMDNDGTQSAITKIALPAHSVYDLVVHPNQEEFIAATNDRHVYRGSLTNSGDYVSLGRLPSKVKRVSISPDGNILATATERGEVMRWDLEAGTKELIYQTPENVPVHALRFSNSGKYLAFGDDRGEVILWDMSNNLPYTDLTAHFSRVNDVAFSPDDLLFASASWDGTVEIWDMKHINDLPIRLTDHNDWVSAIAFSPEADYLITGSNDRIVRVYPTRSADMTAGLCTTAGRNMTSKEWKRFVADDIPYRITCETHDSGENE